MNSNGNGTTSVKQHSYHDAMLIELRFEGGKDSDPRDPGGRTNEGVTQRVFSAWLRKQGLPNRDVFTMTDSERDLIYEQNYAVKIRYDQLPPGIDLLVLDGAINSGVSQSIKWLQRALGLQADGVIADITLQAIYNYPDMDDLVSRICMRRMAFLRSLTTFGTFGVGWTSRVTQLKQICQLWASGSVGPEVAWVPNMNKKATIVDAQSLVSTAPADATAAGGTVTTALTTAQSVLAPLQGHSSVVDQVVLALLVLGGLATAFGFAYAYYARSKNSRITDALDLLPHSGANDNNIIPNEVMAEYVDPSLRGSATGNIAPGVVTTSGRTTGDTETRVNPVSPVPTQKVA